MCPLRPTAVCPGRGGTWPAGTDGSGSQAGAIASVDLAGARATNSTLATDVLPRPNETRAGGQSCPLAARWLASPRDDESVRRIAEQWGGRPLGRPGCAAFDGPARAIQCARALVSELGGVGAAVHSGECEPHGDGLRGVAVDMAGELASGARGGEVLVTQTVRDLVVGCPIELEPRGRRSFRGVPGEWEVFAVR